MIAIAATPIARHTTMITQPAARDGLPAPSAGAVTPADALSGLAETG